jgi:hypothetical protein
MSMKSASAPRRLYTRNGSVVVCYGGLYFGPARGNSALTADKTVRIEVLPRSHGKARIAVTQGTGDNAVTENWPEQAIVFASRA